MKTKRLLLLGLLLIGFNYCFSQSLDEKLLVKYDSQTLQEIKDENPDGYALISYFVENACYFVDMPAKSIDYSELQRINPKTGELSENQEITLDDIENFNPYVYNIVQQMDHSSYYIAGSTGKLLVVTSTQDMQNAVENNIRVSKIK
jgi:hypothetical protein